MKVALLTNMLPPYRIDFFGRLGERCDLLLVADTAIESTREWDVDLDALPFRCEVLGSSGMRRTRKRRDLGYAEDHVLHLGKRIPKVLAEFEPDVVVSGEMGARSLRAALYAKKAKVPLILWWEGTEHTEAGEPFFKRFVRKWLVRRASGYWSNGKESTQYLVEFGADPEYVRDGMTGVSTERYRSEVAKHLPEREGIRQELGLSGCVFLFVGALSGRKGVPQMIDAARLAVERGLTGFSLLFVGDGEHRADVERFAAEHPGVPVHLTGYVKPEEIFRYYAVGDVFVLPTLLDNWPLVTIEAIASGLPELFSRYNGGSADLCIDETYGQVFDPFDTAGFAAALEKMRSREGQRLDSGRVDAMVEKYSPEAQAERAFESIAKVHRSFGRQG